MWPDTRGGTEASNKQDLANALVKISRGSSLRTPLRTGGVVTAATGVLALIWEASARRRSRGWHRLR